MRMVSWGGHLTTLLLCFGMIGFEATSACAHSPYFTQVEKIGSTECKNCELRLIHGDGIFFRDPVQAVLVDAQKRLLAKSAGSSTIFLYCRKPLECLPYDADRMVLLELNPETFINNGMFVPGTSPDDREKLWDIGISFTAKGTGFKERRPDLIEFFSIELELWRRLPTFALLILATTGFIFASNLIFWRCPPARDKRIRSFFGEGKRLGWFLMLIPRIALFIILPFLAIFFYLFLDGFSVASWLATILIGSLAVFAAKAAFTYLRNNLSAQRSEPIVKG
jgi:hypothetical protein